MSKETFIYQVEENRGRIKNTKKFYPMLEEIYSNGVDAVQEELTKGKHIGIQKMHDLAIGYTAAEQEEVMKRFYDSDKQNALTFELVCEYISTHGLD